MTAMLDARCPNCNRRMGWQGRFIDRPPCPKCGHQLPQAELAATDLEFERIEAELAAENQTFDRKMRAEK